MAKKRRKPRPRPPASTDTGAGSGGGRPTKPPDPARRERKERARLAEEAARKQRARRGALRRAIIFALAGLLLFGFLWLRQRAPAPRPIAAAAVSAAKDAGCTGVVTPSTDPVRGHLAQGQTTTYSQRPPTSGIHNPTPLPTSPEIYTHPVDETMAVHFLEHAGIIINYRADGTGALPADVVTALGGVARSQPNTLLIPFTDLPTGTALAISTWNKLQTCPATVTADQATTIANGFADAYVCTSNAPEPKVSPDC